MNGHKNHLRLNAHSSKKSNQIKELPSQINSKNLSYIFHDLKNLFASFLYSLQRLIHGVDHLKKAVLVERLNSMHNCALTAYNLYYNLLVDSQHQQGKLIGGVRKINIDEILKLIIALFSFQASQKNLVLEYNYTGIYPCYSDQNAVNTVLRNLISNSIKYTEENGNINVSIDCNRPDEIKLIVNDSGEGFYPEELRMVLMDTAMTPRQGTYGEKGTGIGLTICNDIVKELGGKMEIKSQRGIGTEVTVILPNMGENSLI